MARTDEQYEQFIESALDQLRRSIRPTPPFDIKQAALLVIDMQNFFVHPDGNAYLSGSRHIRKRIRRLIDLFHSHDRPVIFTRHEHEPDNSDTGLMDLWWKGNHIYKNTWAAEITDKLPRRKDDMIISKNRYSAFYNTDLKEILKEQSVDHVLITGVMTNLCCETTARDAFMHDIKVFFCIDGTTTISEEMHLATIGNLAFGFAWIVTAADIVDQFKM